MTFLALIGIAAIGWYMWLSYLGYLAGRRGGSDQFKALKGALTWPLKVHRLAASS